MATRPSGRSARATKAPVALRAALRANAARNSSWMVRVSGAWERAARSEAIKKISTVSAIAEMSSMTRARLYAGQAACRSRTVRPCEIGTSRKSSAATAMPMSRLARSGRRTRFRRIRLGIDPTAMARAVTATTSGPLKSADTPCVEPTVMANAKAAAVAIGAVRRLPGIVTPKTSPMTIATKKTPMVGRAANTEVSANRTPAATRATNVRAAPRTPMATSTLDLLARVVTVLSLWPVTGLHRRARNPRVPSSRGQPSDRTPRDHRGRRRDRW